jgi:DNA (cytosine-5)-methyltransferase 1
MKNEQSINNFFLSDGQTALPKLTHGSLFSGIGGFDLAAEWAGYQNIFHCEWNEFGQRVLKHYWPNAISYADITKTDFTIHRGSIDILTGGFPCQPYSVAGKRKGKEDDRHLWPEMLRAIREIAPRYIVGENVGGLVSWNGGMVFEEVQTEMENEGYEVQPVILPACSVNAPHRRDRIWFVAYSKSKRTTGHAIRTEKEPTEYGINGGNGITSNTHNNGFYGSENGQGNRKRNDNNEARKNAIEQFEGCSSEAIITDTISGRRIQNNEQHTSRKFEYAGSGWERFPTQSPVCRRDDGLSSRLDGITFPKWRSESIKAYGNAIVPQVAYEIFKCISVFEREGKKNY